MKPSPALGIGDVAEALLKEFPSVTVSKLRFLESEGLIHPPRTPSGYRKFREIDVERVRYILRQQRDHFLPLKVIRTKLNAWERGEEPTTPPPGGPPPETYFATSDVTLDAEGLARTAGVPASVVKALIDHGVLSDDAPGTNTFTDDDLAVVRAAHRLMVHGLEPRHLRSIRQAANREVDLFRQLAGPLLRHASPASRQQAAEVLADVAQAAREMQEAMVRADLRETLDR
ncbi:MAG TPA: MerR family transcriptional regulator [Acidimicrobiia bacterium]|nr:MerR family transcriptional regulator [Acidimicrobiia bacterium]